MFLAVGTLAAFVQADLDLNGTQTGLLVTAVGLVPLFALLPVGRMLDRHGERWLVGAGALVLGCGVAVATTQDAYVAVMALLLLGGTGYATAQPGGSSAVAGWFTGPRRGLAMGIRQTGLPLGGALSAAILPTLAERTDWRTALLFAGGVAVAGAIVFTSVYRDHPRPGPSDGAWWLDVRRLLGVRELRPVLWAGTAHVATQFRDRGVPAALPARPPGASGSPSEVGACSLRRWPVWSDGLHWHGGATPSARAGGCVRSC